MICLGLTRGSTHPNGPLAAPPTKMCIRYEIHLDYYIFLEHFITKYRFIRGNDPTKRRLHFTIKHDFFYVGL